MKNLKLFLPFLILAFSCEWDARLNLINHSNKKLVYFFKIMDLNDTIPKVKYCNDWEPDELVPLYENNLRLQSRWDLNLNKPNTILRIFIYDEDTLIKYGSCGILRKPVYRKRIDLTYEDILKLNWRIDYYDK